MRVAGHAVSWRACGQLADELPDTSSMTLGGALDMRVSNSRHEQSRVQMRGCMVAGRGEALPATAYRSGRGRGQWP